MRDRNRTSTALSGLAATLACVLAVGCGGAGSSRVAGASNPNSKAMRSFRGTPVQADWSSPQFVYTHEKAMIVDKGLVKQAVWIMTANMSKAARLNNREYLVVDSNDEDIVEAQHIFDS